MLGSWKLLTPNRHLLNRLESDLSIRASQVVQGRLESWLSPCKLEGLTTDDVTQRAWLRTNITKLPLEHPLSLAHNQVCTMPPWCGRYPRRASESKSPRTFEARVVKVEVKQKGARMGCASKISSLLVHGFRDALDISLASRPHRKGPRLQLWLCSYPYGVALEIFGWGKRDLNRDSQPMS